MKDINFLNKKEVKKLLNKIKGHYGIKELNLEYEFLVNKEKVYIISKGIKNLDLGKLNINSFGLYFCKADEPRLSIEGSQLIGNFATKNIVELSDNEIEKWIHGEGIEISSDLNGFVIIRHKNDYYGCGKMKNNRLLNYVPKDRRIK